MQVNVPLNEQNTLEYFRQWIVKYTGIYYSEQKKEILYSRLVQLCFRLQIHDLNELYEKLQNGSFDILSTKIAQAVSTTHTYFFREPEVLNYFKEKIVKNISKSDKVKIWSAASSSGQEAYTISILLTEMLGMENVLKNFSILGTDINHQVIKQAENGIYGFDLLKDVEPVYKNKYFKAVGMGQYKVIDQIQSICTFRTLNLISKPWPFSSKFQVIFCRNILYYFTKQQQEEVINNMYEFTVPNGYLITSVTESLSDISTKWVTICPGIHQKL